MSEQPDSYQIADPLPLNSLPAGTNVLVMGPADAGARALSLAMLKGPADPEEGVILISADLTPAQLRDEMETLEVPMGHGVTTLVDCATDGVSSAFPARVLVSTPRDLAGIGRNHTTSQDMFGRDGIERVRSAVISVSTLLDHASFKSVSRFIHILADRITAEAGMGVFLVDTRTHDELIVTAFERFCDGRIEIAQGNSGSKLRCSGLPNQPSGWTSVDGLIDR